MLGMTEKPMIDKEKVYILILTGQGDTYIHLVTKKVWNWIHSTELGRAGEHMTSWPDQTTPQVIINENDGELQHITIGSYQNDRALACPLNMFPDIQLSSHFEFDVANLSAAVHIAGHELGETYNGYIY